MSQPGSEPRPLVTKQWADKVRSINPRLLCRILVCKVKSYRVCNLALTRFYCLGYLPLILIKASD